MDTIECEVEIQLDHDVIVKHVCEKPVVGVDCRLTSSWCTSTNTELGRCQTAVLYAEMA